MIEITEKEKELFLSDSVHKNLTIEIEPEFNEGKLHSCNFYTGDIYGPADIVSNITQFKNYTLSSYYLQANKLPVSSDWQKYIDTEFLYSAKYLYIAVDVCVSNFSSSGTMPSSVGLRLTYKKPNGTTTTSPKSILNTTGMISDDWGNYKTFEICVETSNIKELKMLWFENTDTSSSYATDVRLRFRKPQVRLIDEVPTTTLSYLECPIWSGKTIQQYVTNWIDNITNENVIQESFGLTESLCSQENLKFGLCESAHCEFEVVERYEKFIGRIIRPYINVGITLETFDYSNINFNTTPFSGSIWWSGSVNLKNPKVLDMPDFDNNYLAYTDYVMVVTKINFDFTLTSGNKPPKFYFGLVVKDQNGNSSQITLDTKTASLTNSNRISIYDTDDYIGNDSKEVYITLPTDLSFDSTKQGLRIKEVLGFYIQFVDENNNPLLTDVLADDFHIGNNDRGMYFTDSINAGPKPYNESEMISEQIPDIIKGVPLGVFKVSEVKKNHTYDIIKKSITAYDGLEILNQDVGDWLTKYMWLWDTGNKRVSTSPYFTRFGVEYTRQLFPTLANLMKQLNILSDEDFTFIEDNADFDVEPGNYNFHYNYLWGNYYEDEPYGKGTIGILLGTSGPAGFSEDRLMKVVLTPYGGLTDAELFERFAYSDMIGYWDNGYHGFPSCASVLITFNNYDGTTTKILADSGDYIYVNKNVMSYEIRYSAGVARINTSGDIIAAGDSNKMLTTHVKSTFYEVPEILKSLVNAHLRLVYYNYGTQEIGSFSSSVSGRDVIQSLLEVNGCFFHMNRYGKPEIIYASKAGLYPAENLYPSETLYPRGTRGPLLSMGRYLSMECDDYIVQNYGKIQIKTQSQVKSGESICSYEYIGDETCKNTYIIEDNIFYCAEGTVYEYGSQPEVDEMLKNLFSKISHLTYTPHTTKLRGLPFMECGDRINLITKTGGIESFIFRRTLKGIHALMDTYEAEGDEYNEELNTFDYKVYTPE